MKFKLIEGEGFDATVEKSDFSVTFNLKKTRESLEKNWQAIREVEARKKILEAKMANCEENHPSIKTLDPVVIVAAHIWQDSKEKIEECDLQIKNIQEWNDEVKEEAEALKEQLGIDIYAE